MSRRRCLSIGAGHSRGLPAQYRDFDVVTLDVDPASEPDIVADVRDLTTLCSDSFDAVFMSHLLEHFPRWELGSILEQVARVLRVGGFVEVRVPHVQAVFEAVLQGADIDQPLYQSMLGPITALDLLFGHHERMREGDERVAHRTAFTPAFLERVLRHPGLRVELLQASPDKRFELCGIARKVAEDTALAEMQAEEPLGEEVESRS